MLSGFLQKFRRITYSTSYLAEVDGLRFLALLMVVVIMHITFYLNDKIFHGNFIKDSYWKDFILEGNNGLSLFFVISGFILSLPFGNWYLNRSAKVKLNKYYLRRVTRLEPPYLIILLILFIAQVWILNKYTFTELFPRLLASVFYLHTLIYKSFPQVMPVAWSLEIEVQFYLVAPFLCKIFLIKSQNLRRLIMIAIIFLNIFLWYNSKGVANVVLCLHFFFTGIFLADLYCSGIILFKNRIVGLLIGIASLTALLFIGSIYNMTGYLLKLIFIFFLFHTVLTNVYLKRIFSFSIITIIGGMCYSIYLLHFAIISLVGQLLMKLHIIQNSIIYFIITELLLALVIFFISSFYFLWIEKPFMKIRYMHNRTGGRGIL